MPVPRLAHRAVCCGALLSRAFREGEVRAGRDVWCLRVETALSPLASDDSNTAGASETGSGDHRICCGGASVATANELARVGFRGEVGVHGRLRWVGYVRSSDTPHKLVGGVEWDADSALPRAAGW
ncbi:hypothetical protein JIQ42_02735 [Leishmania sp. Namibia]|uniref:hypothetical protein n=1 Tax=Leishmania sp. Namibia TaxID=2802991 RepID=UPI001B7653AE|nr:hypothetical protein JIQ42_02735 [Leishmania sp. Namibia]